jgi:serine/threonine protein kinase
MVHEFCPDVAYPPRVENAAGPRQLEPGTKLDDKYRIEQLIAVGGMGAVYLGTHTGLRKRVAIKVLNPQSSSPAMIERFHREAITASQIGHEGIAQVTDFGTSYEGEPFLVMEYLEGESLASRLGTSGRLPIEVACELGCAILAPLAAAHEAGIVHRDLKPDNVFLVRQSRGEIVKLLDFGISRAPGLEGEFRLTKTGLVLGTPYYMSPEQARGDSDIGPAADLYAFGVILYEMLVGHVPIEGENYNQLMYRVLTAEYALPRKERPEIPAELEQIILQAMALEPAKRPPSAAELEQQLLAFCRPTFRDHQIERLGSSRVSLRAMSSGSIRPVVTPMAATEVADSQNGASAVALPEPTLTPAPQTVELDESLVKVGGSRRRALWLGGGAVVLVGALVGTLVIAKGGGDGTRRAAAPPTEAAPPRAAPSPVPAPRKETPAAADRAAPQGSAAVEITLRFAVEPAAAKIELDGVPVEGRQITVRRDGAAHRLRITAPGFTTHEDEVHFDESQKLVVQLKRAQPRTVHPQQQQQQRKPDHIESTSPYGS